MFTSSNHNKSVFSLVAGVALLFTGTFLDPQGIIDSTVLIGAGQLIIACLVLAGCGDIVNKFMECLNELKQIKIEREKKE